MSYKQGADRNHLLLLPPSIDELIGEDNVFPAQKQYTAALQQALTQAENWQKHQLMVTDEHAAN